MAKIAGSQSLATRARELAVQLTQWPSVTGTPDEAEFSHNLRRLLADIPYFRDRPEHLMLVASHGSPQTSSVVALVRGTGSRTIILAGHFDTVSISNYGVLASLACDPEPRFGSLHYPLVHLEHHDTGDDFHRAIRSIVPVIEERHKTTIRDRQIFAGISDMSFLGHRHQADQARLVAENTPAGLYVDDARDTALRFPVVNIGPWGRDYHQKWERAHGPYTFDVLPDLVFEAFCASLAQDEPSDARPSPQNDRK